MDAEKVIKSSQEQAVAAWVNQLNQIRLDRLLKDLQQETTNFKEAIKAIEDARCTINWEIIGHNRGGTKGVHGFIAEVAQCGVGNARKLILGEKAGYEWVNDNGPVDLRRDGIGIQQKFVQADGRYSLGAAAKHLEKYPDFLESHGKYQIPKDFYEKIKSLLEMPEKEAGKLPNHSRDGELSYGDWKKIHEFFDQGDIRFSDIKKTVQRNLPPYCPIFILLYSMYNAIIYLPSLSAIIVEFKRFKISSKLAFLTKPLN